MSSTDDTSMAAEHSPAPDGSPAATTGDAPRPLWPGDTGSLPLDVRRVVVRLLKGPYLSQRHDPNLWVTLLVHEDVIRSRLADLLLDLMVDANAEIAFCRNADTGDELKVPKVLRRSSLTFLDTALLLHLREQLLRGQAGGERVVLGYPEILAHMSGYAPHQGNDPKQFESRLRASIRRMENWSILTTTDTEDRWEVSAILTLIVGPDLIAQIEGEYREILAGQGEGDGVDVADAPDDEADESGTDADDSDDSDDEDGEQA